MFFKYHYNKTFLILTFFLLLSFIFIICESEYPLIFNTPILHTLFFYDRKEKLLYNISISYVAAYFFYLLQTYIPQVKANKKAIKALQNDIIDELVTLIFLSTIIKIYTKSNDNTHTLKTTNKCIPTYFILTEKDKNYIVRFSPNLSTKDMFSHLSTLHTKICSSYFFSLLDSFFSDAFSSFPIDEIEQILYCINEKSSYELTESEHAINSLKNFINLLTKCNLYKCNCSYQSTQEELYINLYNKNFEKNNFNEYNFRYEISILS